VGKKKGARETSGGRRGVKYSAWGSLFLMLSLPACFGFLLFTVLDLLGLGLLLGLFHSRFLKKKHKDISSSLKDFNSQKNRRYLFAHAIRVGDSAAITISGEVLAGS
jgi:hypothetical protein